MFLLSGSILLVQNWNPLSDSSFSPFCLCRLRARPALEPFLIVILCLSRGSAGWAGCTCQNSSSSWFLNPGFPRPCLAPGCARTAPSAGGRVLGVGARAARRAQHRAVAAVRTGSLRCAAAPRSDCGWLEAQQWLLQSWVFHGERDHGAEKRWRNGVRAL